VRKVGQYYALGFDSLNFSDGIIALDTETTGLDVFGTYKVDRAVHPARAFMFTFCDPFGNTACMRFPVNPKTRAVLYRPEGLRILAGIIENKAIKKVFFNYSYDAKIIRKTGLRILGACDDALIRQHIINSAEYSFKLKDLCKHYLSIAADDEKALQVSTLKGRRLAKANGWAIAEEVQADYWLADDATCQEYARLDAYRHMALFLAQEEEFKNSKEKQALLKRELKLMKVLDRMETRGVAVDLERNKELTKYYTSIIEKEKQSISDTAGEQFNPNSPKQKTLYFFKVKKYKPLAYSYKKRSKVPNACQHCRGKGCVVCQGTGNNPKCDGEFLKHAADNYADNLAGSLLRLAAAQRMMDFCNTYSEKACKEGSHWILHPGYKQTGTVTGRLSCENPNLQNIASDDSAKKRTDIEYRPREIIIPRRGFTLWIPDYSQIEIWGFAILAKASKMLAALASGTDAHQAVADMVDPHAYDKVAVEEAKKLPKDKLTPYLSEQLHIATKMRKGVKNLQFCRIYGGGIDKVASMMGVTPGEAKKFADKYDAAFPDVARFMKQTVELAKQRGYVVSPYGRTYYVPKEFAYVSLNYLVQGTCSDLLKSGMLKIAERFKTAPFSGNAFLLLQIHDELMMEVRDTIATDENKRLVAQDMVTDWKFLGSPVPFSVGFKESKTRWTETTETKL